MSRAFCWWRWGSVPALVLVAAAWAMPEQSEFQNLQVLTGVSSEEMALIMGAANQSLGVECTYCHLEEEWHLDDLEAKRVAREMMRMLASLSVTEFEILELPSCWTCHRGSPVPVSSPSLTLGPLGQDEAPPGVFSDETLRSSQVYENLEQYGDLPANELRAVMESYSRSLGVECSHCHLEADWASDAKVTKLIARRMLDAQNRIGDTYFDSTGRVSCWTCHRGEVTPSVGLPAE